LGLTALGWLAGCTTPVRREALRRFEFQRAEMGMPVRMVIYARTHLEAADAALTAFDRIRTLNGVFSDYEEDSELSRLSLASGQGHAVPLSPDLWEVLDRAQKLAEDSEGAFDVTVGPYVNLWRRARRERELPKPALLARAREAVGFRQVTLDSRRRTARLEVPGMRLDLGGIAKGYALDEALDVLRKRGLPAAFIACGGDLRAGDPPPGKRGWQVELESVDASGTRAVEKLFLARGALASSGDLFQFAEINGVRYSHIVDPRTGYGITNRSLVHILAPDLTTADSLATAVSVLGPDAGIRLLESRRNVDGRVQCAVGPAVEIRESPGFARRLRFAPQDGVRAATGRSRSAGQLRPSSPHSTRP